MPTPFTTFAGSALALSVTVPLGAVPAGSLIITAVFTGGGPPTVQNNNGEVFTQVAPFVFAFINTAGNPAMTLTLSTGPEAYAGLCGIVLPALEFPLVPFDQIAFVEANCSPPANTAWTTAVLQCPGDSPGPIVPTHPNSILVAFYGFSAGDHPVPVFPATLVQRLSDTIVDCAISISQDKPVGSYNASCTTNLTQNSNIDIFNFANVFVPPPPSGHGLLPSLGVG